MAGLPSCLRKHSEVWLPTREGQSHKDGIVLQTQSGVSRPEKLIGLRWVSDLSHDVSGSREETVTTIHPPEWAWCMLVPRESGDLSAGQTWPRESITWLLGIKHYERSWKTPCSLSLF